VLRTATSHREVNRAVIGISWFWAVGAAYLGQLPAFAKEILAVDQQVVTLMLATFSVGIGAGSIACERMLKGEISTRFAALAALGMALAGLDLYWSGGLAARTGSEIGIGDFLATLAGLHVLADLFLLAAFGGLFTVPFYAIVQARSEPSQRARAVAANNIMNAIYVVVSSVAVVLLLRAGIGVRGVFLVAAAGNALVGFWAWRLLRR